MNHPLATFRMNRQVIERVLPHDTLFMHGNLASNRWWEPTVKALAARAGAATGRAILAEWRGCGRSQPTFLRPEEFHIDTLASDYLGLSEELGAHPCDVVAHSTGCAVALAAALRAPAAIRRLVLLDPIPADGIEIDIEMRKHFVKMRADRDFCAAVLATTIKDVDTKGGFFQSLVDDASAIAPEIINGVPHMLSQMRMAEGLAGLQNRVLVIHGAEDTVLPKEGASHLAALLPNARYQEIPDHGHSLNIEDPERFASLVLEFLA